MGAGSGLDGDNFFSVQSAGTEIWFGNLAGFYFTKISAHGRVRGIDVAGFSGRAIARSETAGNSCLVGACLRDHR